MKVDRKRIFQKAIGFALLALWMALWNWILDSIHSAHLAKIIACISLAAAFVVLVTWLITVYVRRRDKQTR